MTRRAIERVIEDRASHLDGRIPSAVRRGTASGRTGDGPAARIDDKPSDTRTGVQTPTICPARHPSVSLSQSG